MSGELLTLWTIRLALACYAACLAGWLIFANRGNLGALWPRLGRWLWTAGCVLFVVHVACAFQFYHGWSHAAAYEKTAAETEQLLGVRFGEGIYFSYLFLILWVLDLIAIWTWRSAASQPQPAMSPLQIAIHAYLFFIAFNGAIVFEAGPVRWAGIAICLLLGGLAVQVAYNWRSGESREQRSESRSPYPTTEP